VNVTWGYRHQELGQEAINPFPGWGSLLPGYHPPERDIEHLKLENAA